MVAEMSVVFLGTASAYPTPKRGVSCVALRYGTFTWIFDCGEGSQIQLMKSDVKPGKITKIFISHLHGDHVFGLPGLLCTISQNYNNSDPVEIYGPVGLRKFLKTSLELSRSELGFMYKVYEMKECEEQLPDNWQDWKVEHSAEPTLHPNEKEPEMIEQDENGIWNLHNDCLEVQAVWLRHRIPSFGFVIREKPIPGNLDKEKLKGLGVPAGPWCGKLKAGETVTLPSGEEIKPEDVLTPPQAGRKVIILGDTSDSTQVLKIGNGANILVHEATVENSLKEKAIENGHSVPEMAATLAKDLDVKQLVLTHFSQRYKPLSCDAKKNEASVDIILKEAKEVFGENVRCAEDLMTVPIPI